MSNNIPRDDPLGSRKVERAPVRTRRVREFEIDESALAAAAPHTHGGDGSGTVDAANVGYAPGTGADPGNVDDALDDLRADSHTAHDAAEVDYTPNNGGDWTDPDPATVKAALDALASGGGGGVSAHALLDGGTAHSDTAADTVSRGSLVYGNSTPAWDELVVGAANSVLWSDGTDPSWTTAPRLANIADTGGTNRITLATASPQVTITGDLDVSGHMVLADASSLATQVIGAIKNGVTSGAMDGLNAIVRIQGAGDGTTQVRGLAGEAQVSSGQTGAVPFLRGLHFTASHGGGGTVAEQTGIFVSVSGLGPTTARYGANLNLRGFTATETTVIGSYLSVIKEGLTTTPLARGYSVLCTQLTSNASSVLTEWRGFEHQNATRAASGVLTTVYGFYCAAMTGGTSRLPFCDLGSTTGDASGNRFRSNTQFGSVTGAFGGGDGVIGIANATTNPSTNPAAGGVLYATGGALTYRGSAGTVTVLAAA